MLNKNWIGLLDDPTSVASVLKKFGVDLFYTKGLAPTINERLAQLIREEGVKELMKLMSAVILALILLYLGLKK
jgi:hypothetical protein